MNHFDFMKNLQSIQGQMEGMQEKLKNVTAIGSSGGDMVKVTINGHFEVLDVSISEICLDPRDVEVLEDLVQAAFIDASSKVREKIKNEVGAHGWVTQPTPGVHGRLIS